MKKKLQIVNFEHVLCRDINSYSVARFVKSFYEPSRIQRYNLLVHYEHLNTFQLNNDQRKKNSRNTHNFADIFHFISKTKGLGENLTTPRDAADIFPSESIHRSSKPRFVFNTEAK